MKWLNDEIDQDSGSEVVKSKSIPCKQSGARLTLHYHVIPFGVSCMLPMDIQVKIILLMSVGKLSPSMPAHMATSIPPNKGCVVLFDKPEIEGEWECRSKNLELSRCWVAVPAHSPVVFDVNLSIVGEDEKIKLVKDSLSLLPMQCGTNYDLILVDGFLIHVEVGWLSPDYHVSHCYQSLLFCLFVVVFSILSEI